MGEGGQDAEIVLRRGTRLNRLKGQELSKSVTASGWTPKRSERLTSIVSTFSLSSLPFREVGLGIIKFGHPCIPDRTVSRQRWETGRPVKIEFSISALLLLSVVHDRATDVFPCPCYRAVGSAIILVRRPAQTNNYTCVNFRGRGFCRNVLFSP